MILVSTLPKNGSTTIIAKKVKMNNTVSHSNPTQISQVNRVVKNTARLFKAKLFKTSFYSCAIYDSCYLLKNDPMQECRKSIDRLHFQVSLLGFTPCWLDSQYPKPVVNISWVWMHAFGIWTSDTSMFPLCPSSFHSVLLSPPLCSSLNHQQVVHSPAPIEQWPLCH